MVRLEENRLLTHTNRNFDPPGFAYAVGYNQSEFVRDECCNFSFLVESFSPHPLVPIGDLHLENTWNCCSQSVQVEKPILN